jgi:hypothetical protein
VKLRPKAIEKMRCLACERVGRPYNKEHFWPKWLIELTGTGADGYGVNWMGKQVGPLSATIPLCVECNSEFGRVLETPVSRAFHELLDGKGISVNEAELICRWLWKFEGLEWNLNNPHGRYSGFWTLRQRVCEQAAFNNIRDDLLLGMAFAGENDDDFSSWPIGLDHVSERNAIFVSGVFHRIALLVSLSRYAVEISEHLDVLMFRGRAPSDEKVFFPRTRFNDTTDAIGTMKRISVPLSFHHDTQPFRPGLFAPPRKRIELPEKLILPNKS